MEISPSADPFDLRCLLVSAQSGEAGAWNALLGRVRPYLLQVVRRRLASLPKLGLEESSLVQETLLRMDQHFGAKAPEATRFRGEEPPAFLNWIGVISARVVANAVRDALAPNRDRRRSQSADDEFAFELEIADQAKFADAEESIRVAAELENLSADRRRILELRYFDQRSFDEIAQLLGKTANAVRVAHVRALADLRARMGSPP